MPEQVEFVNGPFAGIRSIDGKAPDTIGIQVDEEMQPLKRGAAFAISVYRRRSEEGVPKFKFSHFQKPNHEPFEALFEDGPNQGRRLVSQPPHFFSGKLCIPLIEGMVPFRGDGTPIAVAIYESKKSGMSWCFHLARIEESGDNLEKALHQIDEERARQAANNFYLSPDYSIYSKPPTGEHRQIYIEHGRRRANVDEDIAPLIKAIWERGFETIGSCQLQPSGKSYIAFPVSAQGQQFHDVLNAAGIESTFVPKKLRLKNADTNALLEVNSANVLFEPSDIQKITELVKGGG